MAHIGGFDAPLYKAIAAGPDASTAFSFANKVKADGALYGFADLTDGDTIMYKAVGLDTGEWEVGLGTYTASTYTLARTTVLASSNSDSAVDFEKADASGQNVKVEGLWGVASTASAYTVTAWTADRTLAGTESTAANIAATLATVINDLIAAGILKGTVAAP